MIYVGIDPGKTGAVVAMNFEGAIVDIQVMQDAYWFADYMESIPSLTEDGGVYVFIEKAQAMPNNGSVSMFRYGQHYGELIGVLTALGIPYEPIPPTRWTKEMNGGKKGITAPKSKSLETVRRLFPTTSLTDPASRRSKVPHKGIVDAILIAEYGRRLRIT